MQLYYLKSIFGHSHNTWRKIEENIFLLRAKTMKNENWKIIIIYTL